MFLNIKSEVLRELGAFNTAKEICHQPQTTLKVLNLMQEDKINLHEFIGNFLAKPNARVILTGAGTSAFAGTSIVDYLKNETQARIEAIATTDLVSNPHLYFERETPTLLVSFARSGNSPESVEATRLADALVDDAYHLAVTCNKQGQLYKASLQDDNYRVILNPDETNDIGFAMTSSFTSMIIATLLAFDFNNKIGNNVTQIATVMQSAITDFNRSIKQLADKKHSRVIYLGSGNIKSLAEECSLKLLELTSGGVSTMFDSPLGFRHGPKSFINNDTLVVIMVSNDSHTQQYDIDLINELRKDNIAKDIVTISSTKVDLNGPFDFKFSGADHLNDTELLLPFITWAQIFSVHSSLAHEILTDTPCVSGTV
ncbi:MAG: SIS domain-containing protein, partial [Psychromonas sp.]